VNACTGIKEESMLYGVVDRHLRIVATLAAFLSACGGSTDKPSRPPPPKPVCMTGFVGDASQPLQLELIASDGASGSFQDVVDGGDVPLAFAPQGGYLIYAAVRARNLDVCGAQLSGALRDIDSGVAFGVDSRPVDLKEGADGWWLPDAKNSSNLTNIGVCPDFLSTDVHDRMFALELTLTDRTGRSAMVTAKVVPRCPSNAADCPCQCSAGYVPGTCG
jgi:hypothetical protein